MSSSSGAWEYEGMRAGCLIRCLLVSPVAVVMPPRPPHTPVPPTRSNSLPICATTELPACREAIAYGLYMMTNTFLSASVVAAVLFYGGTLVLRGSMSAGSLVSFMLFQQSLSSAFQVGGRVGGWAGG